MAADAWREADLARLTAETKREDVAFWRRQRALEAPAQPGSSAGLGAPSSAPGVDADCLARQPPCNWTSAEHAAGEQRAMGVRERIQILDGEGIVYDEVAASHRVSRPSERGQIDAAAPRRKPRAEKRELVFGVAAFTGILRLERCALKRGMRVLAVCELDDQDRHFARRLLDLPLDKCASNILHKEWELWRFSEELLFLLACAPCRSIASTGRQLALEDPDSAVLVSAWADMADYFNIPFICGEQHLNVATLQDGVVLAAIDERHRRSGRARTPLVDGSPMGVEAFRYTLVPEVRSRIMLEYEQQAAIDMIGPCGCLCLRGRPTVIADILLPLAQVPAHLYVDGVLELFDVSPPFDLDNPTVAGVLRFGGPGLPVVLGSHVFCLDGNGVVSDARLLTVFAFTARGMCKLFFDDRRDPDWVHNWPVAQLQHEQRSIRVHHINGVAGTTTDFGVPPLYGDKQLILDSSGRARRFADPEIYALGGDADGLELLQQHVPEMSSAAKRRRHGKSLSMTLADAGMARLRDRCDDFVATRRGDVPTFARRAETILRASVLGLALAAVLVVFLAVDDVREPRALVCTAPCGLPATGAEAAAVSHRDCVSSVRDILDVYNNAELFTGVNPVESAFRAGEITSPDARATISHVVVSVLGDAHQPCSHPSMKWLELHEVAALTPELHEPVHLAMATLLSQQQRR